MAKEKIIKDAIHGYITIDEMFNKIIDTAEFQRLKWIEQGSFRILYPAARHDRFIHSLGTFYLADKFYESFMENIKEDLKLQCNNEDRLKNTFLYAALLHDIGHAPFSHTCEGYFQERLDENQNKKIAVDLINAVSKISGISDKAADRFKREFHSEEPAEHEIVSATILVNNAEKFLGSDISKVDLELAARMVIGCPYVYEEEDETEIEEEGIKNCLIRLVNSTTIDVDKLDYITRDTRMSGFYNASIDINRLIKSVTAVKTEGGIYPAYRKNALSVIDNVFRAKTEQGAWMVSHPIVIYDSALLKACINYYNNRVEGYINNIFSIEALSCQGVQFNGKSYMLLSDMDIIHDIKQNYNECDMVKEYFERSRRRHPVWKSYYEFKHIFNPNGECVIKIDEIIKFFKPLIDIMQIEKVFALDESNYEKLMENNRKVSEAVKLLKEFSESEGIEFSFVLLKSTNYFAPKFDPKKVYIAFSEYYGDITYETYENLKNDISHESIKEETFFYLYSKERLNKEQLSRFIGVLKDKIEKQHNLLSNKYIYHRE